MPLYEYKCSKHGKFATLKPMSDGATASCPECGEICDKVLSWFNFTFGWRISDRSMNQIGAPRDELVRNL